MLKQQVTSQIICKKSIRGPDSPPVARFEKLNPFMQRFYFDERKVYSDGTEYSFEELMGRRWMAAKQKQEEKLKSERLEQEVAELRKKLEELTKQRERRPLVEKTNANTQRRVQSRDEDVTSGSFMGGGSGNKSTDPWNGTLAPTETIEVPAIPTTKPAFTIYTDPTQEITQEKNSITENNEVPKKAFEIFVEETEPVVVPTKKSAFEILQDSTTESVVVPPKKPVRASKSVKPAALKPRPVEPKEPFQVDVPKEVPVSSKGAPLEQQPRKSEVTRRMSQDEFFDFSVYPQGQELDLNGITFMLPTCETEFIFKNARGASTPTAFGTKKHVNRVVQKPELEVTAGITAKLSPITETSREYKSSSSSGSSGAHTTTRGMSTTSAFHYSQKRSRILSGTQREDINPFSEELIVELLDNVSEPLEKRKGFHFTNRNLPKMKENATVIKLGNDKYIICRLIDTGAYAKVYAAQIDCSIDDETGATTALSDAGCSKWFALKVCQPANVWEFYICDELHKRLARSNGPDIEISVMIANPAILFKDASILVDEFCPNGTLIKVINLLKKKNKSLPKSMISFFALELLLIIRQIHSCDIIHADVKPDNVLVQNFPSRDEVLAVTKRTTCLKLIDFGRGIDRRAFDAGTTFTHKVLTKGSQCPEMREGKPWSTHTDWFGFLDCLHVMLFGEYVSISKESDGRWTLERKFNKRNHLKEIWDPLTDGLLNMESETPECIDVAIQQLDAWIKEHIDEVCKDGLDLDMVFESIK